MSKVRAVAKSTRLRQSRSSQKEVPHILGQGRRLGGATPCRRPGGAARRSYSTPEAKGSGREDQPHVQRAVAARTQEGLEELFHVQGQEGWQ